LGGNSHGAHATNITVLQSFDDASSAAAETSLKHLAVLAIFLPAPIRGSSGLRANTSLPHLPPSWCYAPKGEGSWWMRMVARRNAGLALLKRTNFPGIPGFFRCESGPL
jgi:hypothetical protein